MLLIAFADTRLASVAFAFVVCASGGPCCRLFVFYFFSSVRFLIVKMGFDTFVIITGGGCSRSLPESAHERVCTDTHTHELQYIYTYSYSTHTHTVIVHIHLRLQYTYTHTVTVHICIYRYSTHTHAVTVHIHMTQ